jgi:hypothetical protein
VKRKKYSTKKESKKIRSSKTKHTKEEKTLTNLEILKENKA